MKFIETYTYQDFEVNIYEEGVLFVGISGDVSFYTSSYDKFSVIERFKEELRYYIQVVREEVYIRKPNEDFDLVKFIEEDNWFDIEILENQFIDRSLLLVHHPDLKEDEFITRQGKVICGGFTIVGNSTDRRKYTLLSAH